jgi:hypothetical protein
MFGSRNDELQGGRILFSPVMFFVSSESASDLLSSALKLFQENQTHQPAGHRPGLSINVALNHDPTGIVEADIDDSYRDPFVLLVRPADQITI